MKDIKNELLELESLKKYLEEYIDSPITIFGLSDISKACISQIIEEEIRRPILLVTYNELQAQKIHKNIKYLNKNVIYIPKKDIVTYSYDAQNMDILYSRMQGLLKLYNNEAEIVIVSIESLMQPVISKKNMKDRILKLMVANEYDIEEIKEKLVNIGYERYDLVEGKGNFSIRGDILDIGISQRQGIRIEFFGDEIDQIRYFEISSQRSNEVINQIKIYPISEEVEKEPNGSILEYLADNETIMLDEKTKIELRAKGIIKDNKLAIQDLIDRNKNIPYILENMYEIEDIFSKIERFTIIELESQDISSKKENTITIEYEKIKKIEDKFLEFTKQDREKKPYVPRKRASKEFREGEKVVFADLKVRRLYSA